MAVYQFDFDVEYSLSDSTSSSATICRYRPINTSSTIYGITTVYMIFTKPLHGRKGVAVIDNAKVIEVPGSNH